MAVGEVLTDNGPNLCSTKSAELGAERRIAHRCPQPCRPQTNGKAERSGRSLADEFLYARVFKSETDRRVRLARWHRRHPTPSPGPSDHTAYTNFPTNPAYDKCPRCRGHGMIDSGPDVVHAEAASIPRRMEASR